MTTPEHFAAWLRGFMDAIDGVPTAAQVERIRAELAKVQAAEPVEAVAESKPKPAEAPKPEPVVLGKDLQKLLDEIGKYTPPAPSPWPTVPTVPVMPWDTQPTWPYPWPYQIWCGTGDRVVCGGGIPQSYGLTLTTDGVVHWPGGWALNTPGTDSVQ